MRAGVLCLATVLVAGAVGCYAGGSKHVSAARAGPSTNPYLASLAYARCLRAHGVPQPLPDKHGEFSLTPADEKQLRTVPRAQREAGMKACFHHISALNNDPLSERAHRRAIKVLLELKKCLRGFGYTVGGPTVRNMSFGRAMFGFDTAAGPRTPRLQHAQLVCEKRVDMARRITRIINEDRRTQRGSGF
jgi:hypothetical protein